MGTLDQWKTPVTVLAGQQAAAGSVDMLGKTLWAAMKSTPFTADAPSKVLHGNAAFGTMFEGWTNLYKMGVLVGVAVTLMFVLIAQPSTCA